MPKCVFEEKLETQFSKARNLVISNLYNSGMEMSDIATILRVNERTIRRAIENAGEEDLTSYVVLIPAGSDGHKEVQ
jgi:transposase-like protein|tara:strand:+ start:3960 stop:4190 length:231 start_codon:yes stop_codon:yes gene_type:complete